MSCLLGRHTSLFRLPGGPTANLSQISAALTFLSHTPSLLKGEIYKNIGNLKNNVNWNGVHINDTISPVEQRQMKDLRCVYAAGRAQGIGINL